MWFPHCHRPILINMLEEDQSFLVSFAKPAISSLSIILSRLATAAPQASARRRNGSSFRAIRPDLWRQLG
jgi:hypothetical protein